MEKRRKLPGPREKREMLENVECLVQDTSRDQMSGHVIGSVLCALSGDVEVVMVREG